MAKRTTVICKDCGSAGIIAKTERLHLEYSRLYCICKNAECGHKWVANISYSHSTRESKLTRDGLLSYLIQQLPNDELVKLKDVVENQIENQMALL